MCSPAQNLSILHSYWEWDARIRPWQDPHTQPDLNFFQVPVPSRYFFLGYRQGNPWKTELFRKSLRTRKFSMGIFLGHPENPYALRISKKKFGPCFGRRIWMSGTKCGSLAKIWGVKKTDTATISKYWFQNESAAFHSLWADAALFWKFLKIVAVSVFLWHHIYSFFG